MDDSKLDSFPLVVQLDASDAKELVHAFADHEGPLAVEIFLDLGERVLIVDGAVADAVSVEVLVHTLNIATSAVPNVPDIGEA